MATILLETTNHVKFMVSSEDEDLSKFKWHAINFGRRSKRYTYIVRPKRPGRGASMLHIHRAILARMHPDKIDDKHFLADHIDGNTLNNTRQNLRLVTRTQNRHNSAPVGSNPSGYRGVHWMKARKNWSVQIHCGGKNYFLGYFDNPIDGARAYNAKALELYGEFARLNKI